VMGWFEVDVSVERVHRVAICARVRRVVQKLLVVTQKRVCSRFPFCFSCYSRPSLALWLLHIVVVVCSDVSVSVAGVVCLTRILEPSYAFVIVIVIIIPITSTTFQFTRNGMPLSTTF